MKIFMLTTAMICALASAAPLRADLAELSGKIDALEAKAKKAGVEARERLTETKKD